MKFIYPVLGVLVLSACSTPGLSVQDGIPFSQVMAETADLPYECADYEARTDSCRGYSTHEPQGNGRYIATSVAALDASVADVQATYTVVERGNIVCSISSTLELQFTREVGLAVELRLAGLESELNALEDTCFVYSRTQDGYRSRVISGPEFALEDPITDYVFFATPRPLRVGE